MPDRAGKAGPQRTELRRLLDRPDAAPRVRSAVARLLGVSVLSIAVIGGLAIWHLARRGRLIRERLRPPRAVTLPVPEPLPESEIANTDRERDAPP